MSFPIPAWVAAWAATAVGMIVLVEVARFIARRAVQR